MIARYRRVTVKPGKHGGEDLRVEFAGQAPTHGEVAYMLDAICLAEDRYYTTGGQGREYFLDRVVKPTAFVNDLEQARLHAERLDAKSDKRGEAW